MKIRMHKQSVIALWLVLIVSVSFELCLNDTNGIENFVKNFAKSYYT